MSRLSPCRVTLALFCLSGAFVGVAQAAAPPCFDTDSSAVTERTPTRVGQIIIVGNERTRQEVILRQIQLHPGQVLSYPDVRLGEKNLARLGIFEVSDEARPTITILDNPSDPDSEYKDVLVTVQETATGSLFFGVGVDAEDGLFLSVVLSERNLDVARFPTSLDDLTSGDAFRGAGQEFRAELRLGTMLPRCDVRFRDPAVSDKVTSLGARLKEAIAGFWESMNSEPARPIEACEPCR